MNSRQEGGAEWISAVAAVAALVLAYVAWQYPEPVGPCPWPASARRWVCRTPAALPDAGDVVARGSSSIPPTIHILPKAGTSTPPAAKGEDHPGSLLVRTSCGASVIANLRPGAPAQVASGLVVLSVTTGRMGSETYLTLGLTSDRNTLAEAVFGAPARYRIETSAGPYFVNVIAADLETGALTVQVGCEEELKTP